MKYTLLFAITLLTASCDPERAQQAAGPPPDKHVSCPRLVTDTPWNLEAKRGIDFWTCRYTYAVTGKPLFEAMISNHVGAPPLKLYGFYPLGGRHLWFQELSESREEAQTYWRFDPTGSRSMSTLAISFKAANFTQFKEKAMIAESLEP